MLNQIEFRQQPYMSLASLMLSLQFKVQLTLEVAQSELRSSITGADPGGVMAWGADDPPFQG